METDDIARAAILLSIINFIIIIIAIILIALYIFSNNRRPSENALNNDNEIQKVIPISVIPQSSLPSQTISNNCDTQSQQISKKHMARLAMENSPRMILHR